MRNGQKSLCDDDRRFMQTVGTNSITITYWLGFLAGVCCILGSASAQGHPRAFQLQAVAPRFWNLVELDVVATGFGFTEGPMWDPAGFLYVSAETRPIPCKPKD